MQFATLYPSEGINTSVILCSILESLSGNLTRSVSGMFVVIKSTVKGWISTYNVFVYIIIVYNLLGSYLMRN